MKKVIRLEEFIDDMYSLNSRIGSHTSKTDTQSSYKLLIQTQAEYSNLVDDFFQFKYFLGELIYVKVNTGQQFIIPDQDWFFEIISKLVSNQMNSTKLDYDQTVNVSSLAYSKLEESTFLDEFKIADYQQIEFISQIIVSLDLLMEIETEKQNSFVIPNHFQNIHPSQIDLKEIWTDKLDGCFQVSSFYEFPFRLASSVLVRVFRMFIKLFKVDYLTEEYFLFQEGCFNCLIRYWNGRLEVSVRSVDISAILSDEQLEGELDEFKKSILCLFNEYKIVVECCLFKNSIPFKVN